MAEKQTFQFGRVGYSSVINNFSIRYANGAKNKPADFTYDKLMDMDAMQAYLNESNAKLTDAMNKEFGDMFESVGYAVRVFGDDAYSGGGLIPQLNMVVKGAIPEGTLRQCETYLENYQKSFAKAFNKQPFTETEYGFAKFPKSNKFGVDFTTSERLVPKERISVLGEEGDNYKEIIAFPSFLGGYGYWFKFEPAKWPGTVDSTEFWTKDGSMRESTHPMMADVKNIISGQMDAPDSLGEVELHSDYAVFVGTESCLKDSEVYGIANKMGEYGLAVTRDNLADALSDLQSQMKAAGMEL